MQNFKEKLIAAIKDLPEDVNQLYQFEQLDKFPLVLDILLSFQKETYKKDVLVELLQNKQTSFDFPFLVNKLIKSLEPLKEWFEENSIVFERGRLSDFIKEEAKRQEERIQQVAAETKALERSNSDLINQNKAHQQQITNIEIHEQKYQQLLQDETQLKARKEALLNIEKQVRDGGLIALEQEINAFNTKMQATEAEWKQRNQEKATAQEKFDTRLQAIQTLITKTGHLGKAQDLFAEIKAKCTTHNQKVQAEFLEKGKELAINIEFTEETSNQLFDASIENRIKEAKRIIASIENDLQQKIK